MPEVEYTALVDAPVERVWDYVQDLQQWCHLMIGYEALEIVDDRRSIWTLRGDVGILTRQVKIQIDITEWTPRERVTFEITGLTERLEGGGAFLMNAIGGEAGGASEVEDAGSASSAGSSVAGSAPAGEPIAKVARKDGPLRRLRFRIARAMLRRVGRKAAAAQAAKNAARAAESTVPAVAAAPAAPAAPTEAAAAAGGGSSQLTFQLNVKPLGPMAPMLDLLMAPMLEPAAQDLADGIRAAVQR